MPGVFFCWVTLAGKSRTWQGEIGDEVRTNCVWYCGRIRNCFSAAAIFSVRKSRPRRASTHHTPQFYYGFLGVTFLWQLAFVLIAKDPVRYRPLMLIAILEKFIYTVPVVVLYTAGKVQSNITRSSLVDPIFGILFIIAYFRTNAESENLTPRSH